MTTEREEPVDLEAFVYGVLLCFAPVDDALRLSKEIARRAAYREARADEGLRKAAQRLLNTRTLVEHARATADLRAALTAVIAREARADDELREALRAFGERLAAEGYGWEAIITREGPHGEETVAHLTTANPDPAAIPCRPRTEDTMTLDDLRAEVAALPSYGRLISPEAVLALIDAAIAREARADERLRKAARAILPEVISAELPSAITSDDPLVGIERLKAIGDRWEALRAALGEPQPCGCAVDAPLGMSGVCPACGHRDHGSSGCREGEDTMTLENLRAEIAALLEPELVTKGQPGPGTSQMTFYRSNFTPENVLAVIDRRIEAAALAREARADEGLDGMRTEAGKWLLENWSKSWLADELEVAILAIQAEAAREARADEGLRKAAQRLVKDFDPFDYEQGLCYWCGGGWEDIPGPRGGKLAPTRTGKHKDDCPFAALEDALRAASEARADEGLRGRVTDRTADPGPAVVESPRDEAARRPGDATDREGVGRP